MARGASPGVRAEKVIEAGLGLYSQGDLVGALKRWRHALEIDPDNRRAREYVTYVEEHYEVLDRKLRGERAAPAEDPGTTIEMEADDPMDEIDAYDSVEVSMPDAELPSADLRDAGSSPTEEMKPQKIVVKARGEDDELTGEEATKAEGLTGLRRRASVPPVVAQPVREESVDEGWSLEGMEDVLSSVADALDDVLGPREEADTLEIASNPSLFDDLSDLGARLETHDPFAEDTAGGAGGPRTLSIEEQPEAEPDDDDHDHDDDDEPESAIQRPSDDSTGEVTRPERRGRPDSGRLRSPSRSTAPPSAVAPPPRPRTVSVPPPARPAYSEPRSEFDLADFDDPDAPSLGSPMGAVVTARPSVSADEGAEVRVTFRNPRDSENPKGGAPKAPAAAAAPGQASEDTAAGEDDEATVDRLRPPAAPISFDDETYERPSLSMLAEAASDLDSLYGDAAESDDLALERRPGSEGDTGLGDSSERETTQLYQRSKRASKGAVSMELIAAELEADLDEAVSIDPSLGEDAVKARVGWLINRARSENHAGHFPVAVVAIDLALEQHPDSAVAQKLIHSNREVLNEVYRAFLGNMHAVPILAMAMDKIPMHELDHRAAFLLSRIDGVLTLEDVLDVSGMARLEAFRHLSRLLLRGFLELRA